MSTTPRRRVFMLRTGLVTTLAVSGCLRPSPTSQGQFISLPICTMAQAPDQLVYARVASWGQPFTHPGKGNVPDHTVSSITFATSSTVRGAASLVGQAAPVVVYGGVNADGSSLIGDFTLSQSKEGYFFLTPDLGSQYINSGGGYFWYGSEGALHNVGLYAAGIAESDFLAQANAPCPQGASGSAPDAGGVPAADGG